MTLLTAGLVRRLGDRPRKLSDLRIGWAAQSLLSVPHPSRAPHCDFQGRDCAYTY